jgi:hypothetical protein
MMAQYCQIAIVFMSQAMTCRKRFETSSQSRVFICDDLTGPSPIWDIPVLQKLFSEITGHATQLLP